MISGTLKTPLTCLLFHLTVVGFVHGQSNRIPQRSEPFDPSRFFETMFGEESEADRAALQRIKIPIRDEQRYGGNAVKSFRQQLKQRGIKVVNRGRDVTYLRCLVNQLRPLMKNHHRYAKINVLLAESDDVDARSFPGGTMVVFRGLIDFCESEAGLVGILGHELSHADRGHQLYYLRRFKQAEQAMQSKQFDPRKMMNLGSSMAKTFARPFRPEEESEADRDGATWAHQLGYDADEMAHVFLRLHERDGNKGNAIPSFFRSHPFHYDRYSAILDRSKELKETSPNKKSYIGRKNIEQRTCRKREEFSE